MMTTVHPIPSLGNLLEGLCEVPSVLDRPCGDLCLDHRDVRPNDVFVALDGARHTASRFIGPALDAGALAVVCETPPESALAAPEDAAHRGATDDAPALPRQKLGPDLRILVAPALRGALPTLATRRYGGLADVAPLIGVTGTNGKTTVAWLCAAALAAAGRRALYVGTLGTGRITGDGLADAEATRNTTPDLFTVLRRLDRTATNAAAIEMSSHALAQGRLAALRLDVAVLTNLGRDHLDYHQTLEEYRAAKFRILCQPGLKAVALNVDDPEIAQALDAVPPTAVVWGMGAGPAGVVPTAHWVQRLSVQCGPADTRVALRVDGHTDVELSSRLVGHFHAENLIAAFTALCAAGLLPETAAATLSEVPPVPGRFQRVRPTVSSGAGQNAPRREPAVLVDYAHTPEAVARLIEAVRQLYPGPLYLVLGCGGDRDVGKRGPMGAAAAMADVVVVTSDNPRSEDPSRIATALVDGVKSVTGASPQLKVELDRARAIAWAITAAADAPPVNGKRAVVVIAGKGHETTQEVAGAFMPFDDCAVAAACLDQMRTGA